MPENIADIQVTVTTQRLADIAVTIVTQRLADVSTLINITQNVADISTLIDITEPVEPECIEGATKCVGRNLYKCVGGYWTLEQMNAPECIEEEGDILAWLKEHWYVPAGAGIIGAALLWPSKKPSPKRLRRGKK